MNRVELVGETMRRALDELATVAPEWLLARMRPEWGERYSRKIDTHRICRNQDKLQALAKTIGRDGYTLLQDVYAEQELVEIRTLPAIEMLRRIWLQQYYIEAEDVQWREKKSHGFPPARKMIASPDDQDARYGSKDGSTWTGYKVHLTETCEQDAPRLVTHIETTVATSRDAMVTEKVQTDCLSTGETRGAPGCTGATNNGCVQAPVLPTKRDRGHGIVGCPCDGHPTYRYRGLARTHLQHVATAAAINLTRVADWLSGKWPKSSHCSPFATLAMQC